MNPSRWCALAPRPARVTCRHAARSASLALMLPLLGLVAQPARACATCGCTLSADAAMGYSAEPGWRLSEEYDYIHQDQLRSGTHAVSAVPDGTELERETLNRYITTGVSYSPTSAWNITLFVPYVVRTHSTYGEFDSTQPLPPLSSSRSSSIGDIRIIGSYQGCLPTHNLGIQLGAKLPSGKYGTAIDFYGGPSAGDAPGRQPAAGHRQHGRHCGRLLLPAGQPGLRFLRQRPIPERRQASHGPTRE